MTFSHRAIFYFPASQYLDKWGGKSKVAFSISAIFPAPLTLAQLQKSRKPANSIETRKSSITKLSLWYFSRLVIRTGKFLAKLRNIVYRAKGARGLLLKSSFMPLANALLVCSTIRARSFSPNFLLISLNRRSS